MFRYIGDIVLFFLIIYIIKGVLRSLFPFLSKPTNPGGPRSSGPFTGFGSGPFTGPRPGGRAEESSARKPEGKIEVDYVPPKKEKKSGDFEGDFIDYEDIKK